MSNMRESKSIILGSKEKFDLRSVPFSIKGSYMCIHEDAEDRCLYLSITRSPSKLIQRKNLIKLVPVVDNKELPFRYEAEPGKLTIYTCKGTIRISYASDKQMRVLGNGVNLRFCFQTMQFENASPKENGDVEIAYTILGKLLFVPLRGGLWHNAKWIPSKAQMENFMLELIAPVETGEYETAIHEYYSNGWRDKKYIPFEECAAAMEKDFMSFYSRFRPVPDKYRKMAELAAWTIWTHTIYPEGNLKNPVVYTSRTSLIRAVGFPQCYQAMAVCNIREAVKMVLNMFEYRNENGRIPNYIGDIGISYTAGHPPIHGFALDYIMNGAEEPPLSQEDYQELYDRLSGFARWWLTRRDHSRSGIPQYYHVDESGWTDATIFKKGLPLQSGDLLAWLILLCEYCSKVAAKAGIPDEAGQWMNESKRLLSVLINDFWDGNGFISRLAETGKTVDNGSIVSLLPIILGKRLPQNIIDRIAGRLANENEYMTEGGIVSEILGSEEFSILDGFMQGGIAAPVQALLAIGLKNAGKGELSRKIASRFCDFACENGLSEKLSPFRNDPGTGLPIKKEERYKAEDRNKIEDRFENEKKEAETVEPWTSWSAASFLITAGTISG